MKLAKSKLFAAIAAIVLLWVVFTQVRMLDGKALDTAKATALKSIPNPETAKIENLEKVQQGDTTVVCGEYSIKDEAGDYQAPKRFSVVVKEPDAEFSEAPEDVEKYCALPGKR